LLLQGGIIAGGRSYRVSDKSWLCFGYWL